MNNSKFLKYHEYLKTKSLIGNLYRQHYVYSILEKYITGLLLDYGCGLGDMLARYKNSIGVDINPYNIEYCISRGVTAYLLNSYSFDKVKFDTIILDNVIEHVSNPMMIVKNISKVSRSKTVLIIGVPGQKGFASDSDHKIYYDKDNLVPLFSNHGYVFKKCIFTPWKSEILNKYSKRYCQYFIFQYK